MITTRAAVTPMTSEGVSDPSQLSGDGRKAHYRNRNAPRKQQAENRAKKGDYRPRGVRPAHHDGERV